MSIIIITLFKHHSYLLLFFVNLLELIALPVSGEVTMSYSGFLVYQKKMNYFLAIIVASLGTTIGVTVSYLIGRKFGYNLILKFGKYIHFGPEKYEKTANWFDHHGNKLLIFSYFIPGVRHFTGYFAGISKLTYKLFALNAYIGAVIWACTFITLGKILGPKWEKFHHSVSKYLGVGIIVFVLFFLALYLVRRYNVIIKSFVIRNIVLLTGRFFHSLRRTKVFIVFLAAIFLTLLIFAFGVGENYLHNEFREFDQVSEYMIFTLFNDGWVKIMYSFQILQTPLFLFVIIVASCSLLFMNRRNFNLEAIFYITIIFGAVIFKEVLTHVFHYLKPNTGSLLKIEFPNEQSFMSIVVYGLFTFLLVRHIKNDSLLQRIRYITPFFVLLILLLIGISNIYFGVLLPSEITAGYTFGGTWLFLNLLLLEILRLVQFKQDSLAYKKEAMK